MNKFFFIFDKNKKAQFLKKKFLKRFKNSPIQKSKAIIVCGGDGFMLSNIRKFYKYKKPFYGINSGDYGFLMNKFSKKQTIKNFCGTLTQGC